MYPGYYKFILLPRNVAYIQALCCSFEVTMNESDTVYPLILWVYALAQVCIALCTFLSSLGDGSRLDFLCTSTGALQCSLLVFSHGCEYEYMLSHFIESLTFCVCVLRLCNSRINNASFRQGPCRECSLDVTLLPHGLSQLKPTL